ncbi:MAG: DUF3168 domain-containing protein [Pseudomonadota bacterium]
MSDILPSVGADYALQEAVFSVLIDDSSLTDLLGGEKVFDRAPEGTDYPYVTFTTLNMRDASTTTEAAFECRLTLNVWSRELGRRQVLTILNRIRQLLHDRNLALSDYVLVNLREELSDVLQDGDKLAFRGITRFRAFIETNI